MVKINVKQRGGFDLASGSRGRIVLSVLSLCLTATALFCAPPAALAASSWDIEGNHGVLYVEGALTESACRLEMDSMRQDIRLEDVATGQLAQPGVRGVAKGFQLRLRDCLRSSSVSRDERSGALSWGKEQPVVNVSFHALRDANNPQLVKAQGVSGLGLRLLDAEGQDVRLGSRGAPQWAAGERGALNYSVVAERTPAPLWAGVYQAIIDFSLSYE